MYYCHTIVCPNPLSVILYFQSFLSITSNCLLSPIVYHPFLVFCSPLTVIAPLSPSLLCVIPIFYQPIQSIIPHCLSFPFCLSYTLLIPIFFHFLWLSYTLLILHCLSFPTHHCLSFTTINHFISHCLSFIIVCHSYQYLSFFTVFY